MNKINDENQKWYYKNWVIALAILSFGPLGLFLVWLKPGLRILTKAGITLIVFLLTIWLWKESLQYYKLLTEQYTELLSATKSVN